MQIWQIKVCNRVYKKSKYINIHYKEFPGNKINYLKKSNMHFIIVATIVWKRVKL